MAKIAAIQMASGTNVSANLIEVSRQILSAVQAGAKMVVLPENFSCMVLDDADQITMAETEGTGQTQEFLSEQARKNKVWIVAGTIPLHLEKDHPDFGKKTYTSCLVYNDSGERISRYNKVHLFDVYLDATKETYKESETIVAGKEAVVVETPFGKVGLAICYDVRFPELFRQLIKQGAEIIVIPSAFTAITGKAHWEILLRARAIENLSYVVASAQGGFHVNGRQTYGNSIIVDPWGTILDVLPNGSGYAISDIDINKLKNIRQSFPALDNRKISCTLPNETN